MELFEEEKLVLDVDGEEKEFDILFSYPCEETGKVYIGYTDNTFTDDGRKKLYYSAYDPIIGPTVLEKVKTPEEIQFIKDILREIDRSVKNGF